MYWVVFVLLILLGGFCGFMLGVAYGQEHRDE